MRIVRVEVKHGPDQGEAAGLAWEAADHLGAALNLAERPFEQVGRSPPAALPGRAAQVNHERVQIVGEAFGGGGVAGLLELVDQRLEPLLSVALVDRLIERPPKRPAVGLKLARRADATLLRAIRRHRRFHVGVSITATAAGGATSTAAAAVRKLKLAEGAVSP